MTTCYEICHREPTEPGGGEEVIVVLVADAMFLGGFV
jgi:hypothetical protein